MPINVTYFTATFFNVKRTLYFTFEHEERMLVNIHFGLFCRDDVIERKPSRRDGISHSSKLDLIFEKDPAKAWRENFYK